MRTCGNDCVLGPDRGMQRIVAVYKMQRIAAEIVESKLRWRQLDWCPPQSQQI